MNYGHMGKNETNIHTHTEKKNWRKQKNAHKLKIFAAKGRLFNIHKQHVWLSIRCSLLEKNSVLLNFAN